MKRHGLTGSEARVPLQLAEEQDAAEIARRGRTALSAVRTHIRAALGKRGVPRQTQLVARCRAARPDSSIQTTTRGEPLPRVHA